MRFAVVGHIDDQHRLIRADPCSRVESNLSVESIESESGHRMDEMIFQFTVFPFVDVGDIQEERRDRRNIANEKDSLILFTVRSVVVGIFDENNNVDREIILVVGD